MTDVYVDTSALLKRVFIESGSTQLRALLHERSARGDLLVSSELTWVEVTRAILRRGASDIEQVVADACSGIARQRLTAEILRRAERIGLPELRSLDAIHVSAALGVGASELLTFDHRLSAAAESVGVKAIP